MANWSESVGSNVDTEETKEECPNDQTGKALGTYIIPSAALISFVMILVSKDYNSINAFFSLLFFGIAFIGITGYRNIKETEIPRCHLFGNDRCQLKTGSNIFFPEPIEGIVKIDGYLSILSKDEQTQENGDLKDQFVRYPNGILNTKMQKLQCLGRVSHDEKGTIKFKDAVVFGVDVGIFIKAVCSYRATYVSEDVLDQMREVSESIISSVFASNNIQEAEAIEFKVNAEAKILIIEKINKILENRRKEFLRLGFKTGTVYFNEIVYTEETQKLNVKIQEKNTDLTLKGIQVNIENKNLEIKKIQVKQAAEDGKANKERWVGASQNTDMTPGKVAAWELGMERVKNINDTTEIIIPEGRNEIASAAITGFTLGNAAGWKESKGTEKKKTEKKEEEDK